MNILRRLRRKIQKTLFSEQWSVLVCDRSGAPLKVLAPPPDRMWADPFPVEHDGHLYIFVEQQFTGKNGTLGYIELFDDLSCGEFRPILETDCHLSYPNVFCVDGTWYMIPETHERRTIDLYRAERFPDRWSFERTLIGEIEAVDTTAFSANGTWWLLTSDSSQGYGLNGSLSAFYADSFPSSEWKAHPLNPVVRGKGSSRMAGSVFLDGPGKNPVRPAQDCRKEYGKAIVLREIMELSKTAYRERTIGAINPEKSLDAACTHTVNRAGTYVVRDIKVRKPRLW